MELWREEIAEVSFATATRRKIVHASPEPYELKTVILVSPRFFKEARAELAVSNAVLAPNVGPDDGCTTIRGYPVVAVPWLKDKDFEYWSNAAN